jgi:hypothetical protein
MWNVAPLSRRTATVVVSAGTVDATGADAACAAAGVALTAVVPAAVVFAAALLTAAALSVVAEPVGFAAAVPLRMTAALSVFPFGVVGVACCVKRANTRNTAIDNAMAMMKRLLSSMDQ